jgi:hypothetical protein
MKYVVMFFIILAMSPVFADSCDISKDNSGGWCDAPLTGPFDTNCEYRIYLEYSVDDVIYANEVRIDPDKEGTHLAYYFNQGGHQTQFWVQDNNKTIAECVVGDCSYGSVKVELIQQRCKLPDTTPPGLIALFNTSSCPDGWKDWPFGEPNVKCKAGASCFLTVCKKNQH